MMIYYNVYTVYLYKRSKRMRNVAMIIQTATCRVVDSARWHGNNTIISSLHTQQYHYIQPTVLNLLDK